MTPPDVITPFIATLTSCVTAAISWMTSMVTFIGSKPLILIPMLVFFVAGGAVGLVSRLVRG